jgi:predicted Zn-dependent protease
MAYCQDASTEAASDDATLSSTLLLLERKAGLTLASGDPLNKRLEAIELKVFGQVKSGALVDRIESVKQALADSGSSDACGQGKEGSSADQNRSAPSASPPPLTRVRAQIESLVEDLPPANLSMPLFYRVEPVQPVVENDYLKDVLNATKQRVMRFRTMPIPVYITPYQTLSYTRACVEAFENWEERSGGLIRFVQVDTANQSRIRVVWKRLGMSTDTENCALGAHTVTRWTKHPKGKMAVMAVGTIPVPVYIPRLGPRYTVPAQVIEVNVDLIDKKAPDYRLPLLKNIVTHELGHALGLLGHSQVSSDMMYAVTDENSRISKRDLNTLFKLYEMKVDIPL